MKETMNVRKGLPKVILLAGLIGSTAVSAQQESTSYLAGVQCNAGYAGTWIIGRACDLGGNTNIKTNDAIDIQCDNRTGEWSIDFYEEPANADPNVSSQAERLAVCPGNGFITKTADDRQILQCNYWESIDNVTRQLEFELQPGADFSDIQTMNWLSREQDNPNMICSIAARPDSGTGTGTGTGTTAQVVSGG